MASKSIFLCAGEVSGDLHGSVVIQHLKKMLPDYTYFGVGGDRLSEEGMELLYHVNQMSIIGITEVVRSLPFIRKALNKIENELKKRDPALIILIDYPGFNIRIGQIAKKLNKKVFYYISPQIWAWGKHRIKKITEITSKMALIFAFEEKIYREAGLETVFVGHPLLDIVHSSICREDFLKELKLEEEHPIIGILPGSRIREVKTLLPPILKSLQMIKKSNPYINLIIGAADSVPRSVYESLIPQDFPIQLFCGRTYDIMQHSNLLLVASGTATLEAAILGSPMIILYKVSFLSYLLGHYFLIKIPYIGLANIIAGREIVPELIQGQVKPELITEQSLRILCNADEHKKTRENLKNLREKLGDPGAAERTAKLIADMLK